MKIAIIANGFTGSTLPLAKHLCSIGHTVDCFYLVKIGTTSIESLDFDMPIRLHLSPSLLSSSNCIYNYLDKNVNIYTISVFKRKKRLEKILIGKIRQLFNIFIIKQSIKSILQKKYDFCDLVVHSELEVLIGNELHNNRVPFCVSFHEVVTNHFNEQLKLKEVVLKAIKWNTKLITHSDKTKCDLLSLYPDNELKSRVEVIKFGKFESYLSFGLGKKLDIEPNYLLYLGYIHPYKGLRFLYEAVIQMGKDIPIKIVVAGSGSDPILDKMANDTRFFVINRFIENSELVSLIRNCKAIVCPYTSASQSGLVQTGMLFQKPIIATRVGAFPELLIDGINGFLANPSDASSLMNAIYRCSQSTIKMQSVYSKSVDWKFIVKQYNDLIFEKYENC